MRPLLSAALLLLSCSAHAQIIMPDTAPLAFSRSSLIIAPPALPEAGAQPQTGGTLFKVEVRSADSTQSPGWFSFSGLKDDTGLLLVNPAPSLVAIEPVNDYAPTDVLLIDEYGTIVQIMPQLVLAELQQALPSDVPILAALYLKGGMAEASSIHPGDHVSYKLFKKRPVVLRQAPADTPGVAAAPASPSAATPEAAPSDNGTGSKKEAAADSAPPRRLPDGNAAQKIKTGEIKPRPPTQDELIDQILKRHHQ